MIQALLRKGLSGEGSQFDGVDLLIENSRQEAKQAPTLDRERQALAECTEFQALREWWSTELVEFPLDPPLRVSAGEVAGLYIHSTAESDDGIVYDEHPRVPLPPIESDAKARDAFLDREAKAKKEEQATKVSPLEAKSRAEQRRREEELARGRAKWRHDAERRASLGRSPLDILPGYGHQSKDPFHPVGFYGVGAGAWSAPRSFVGRIEHGVRWKEYDRPAAFWFWIRLRLKAMIWYKPGDELLERSEETSTRYAGVYEQGKTAVPHMAGKKWMGGYAAWLDVPSAGTKTVHTFMGGFRDPREAARARHEARRVTDPEVAYRDVLYHYFDCISIEDVSPLSRLPRHSKVGIEGDLDPILAHYGSYSYAPDFVKRRLVTKLESRGGSIDGGDWA